MRAPPHFHSSPILSLRSLSCIRATQAHAASTPYRRLGFGGLFCFIANQRRSQMRRYRSVVIFMSRGVGCGDGLGGRVRAGQTVAAGADGVEPDGNAYSPSRTKTSGRSQASARYHRELPHLTNRRFDIFRNASSERHFRLIAFFLHFQCHTQTHANDGVKATKPS